MDSSNAPSIRIQFLSMCPRWTVEIDSDVTRTCFFLWIFPVYHIGSLRRPRTSKTVHRRHRHFSKNGEQHVCNLRRFLERLPRFDPKRAPNKALLCATEIIVLDTRSLQRAWALIPTRSKPLKKCQCPKCQSAEITTLRPAAQTRPLQSLLQKGAKFEVSPRQ